MGKSRETLMDPKRAHHGESGTARDMSEAKATVQMKRGRDIVTETPERKCKRHAQAVAVSVSQAKCKKQRAVRDEPVLESAATAIRLVAAEDGVDAATVERDHCALEARSERPVRADKADAVTTAPRPLGPGPARGQAVIHIHPALPVGAVSRRRERGRGRGGRGVKVTATKAVGVPTRAARRRQDREDNALIARAKARGGTKRRGMIQGHMRLGGGNTATCGIANYQCLG